MYNVFLHWPGYGNIIRANRVRSFLSSGEWDIVGLAEVYSETQMKMILNDTKIEKIYPFQLSKIQYSDSQIKFNTQATGLVLLSKYPIVESELYIYQTTQKKMFPLSKLSQKGTIYAEIDIQGKQLGIYLTHLFWGRTDTQIQIRSSQLKELKQFIEKKKRIDKVDLVIGDLNLMSHEYDNLMVIFDDFSDAWIEIHGEEDPGYTWTLQNTFVYFLRDNHRYDYMLASQGLKPKSMKILHPTNSINIIPRNSISSTRTSADRYYQTMKYVRWLFFPFGLLLHLSRFIYGLPIGLLKPMDLSDHYPLEGEFVI